MQLSEGKSEAVLGHTKMAAYYREHLARLREALSDEGARAEATALMRKLVDRIVLAPVTHEARGTLAVGLHGWLKVVFNVAANAKRPPKESGFVVESVKFGCGGRIWSRTYQFRAETRCLGGLRGRATGITCSSMHQGSAKTMC